MENSTNITRKGMPDTPHPYWIASTPETSYPELLEDVDVDAAVIGGGMTGITTAVLLKKEGLRVAVIDADRIVQGTSGHTTAKITSQHSLIYNKIKKKMGQEMAKQYADANEAAIKQISDLIGEHNIQCDFDNQSSYVYTQDDNYVQKIVDESDTASSLGIKAFLIDKIPLPIDIKAAVRFDNQARFHPRKYLLALAGMIPGGGSFIYENTRAIDVEEGSTCSVVTKKGKRVHAKYVIVASHFPFYDGGGLYFTRLYPERSYALGIRIRGAYPGGMYVTAEDPGRSLRSQPLEDGELVIVSGEHHKTGQGGNMMAHYENLKRFSLDTFEVEEISYRWSTQDYTSADEVPYVGRITSTKPNIFVASGFRKWGMTNSTASAMIIRDLIVKGESLWEPVYSPSRFTPGASANKFVSENLNVAGQLISGKISPAPEDVDVNPGEGKIVSVNGQRTGVYMDEKGVRHSIDTTCTHMGCELMWNDAEKTWDCPCHGSRFTYEGDIVEGPALKPKKNQ